MAARSQRFGLTWAIIGIFTIALVVLVLVLFLVVPRQADEYLTQTLQSHGRGVARELKDKVKSPQDGYDPKASAHLDSLLEGDSEVRNAWMLVCPLMECRRTDVIARSLQADAATEAMLKQFNAAGRPLSLVLEGGEELVSETFTPNAGAGTAYMVVTMNRAQIDGKLQQMRRTLFYALFFTTGIFLALVGLVSRILVVRPIRDMLGMAAQLSEADLSGTVAGAGTRELDQLASALNNIGQGLRETLGRVRGVAESVAQVIDQISRSAATTSGGSTTVLTRVEETSSAMEEMLASLKGIAANVETLYHSAEESSSSILEMSTTNEEVSENVTKMAAAVEETSSAIDQMTYTTKEVAKNLGDLLKSAEVTSSSIREMDGAISQVEAHAYETARLSEQVSSDSERGMESIHKTIAGIDKIRVSSSTASNVIEHLGRRIGEIGNIVDVIDDVAEQTNLLALNAAIIAAQAGEHGKGFAVVAEEIKDLAERTGSSTKEIAELIRSVQDESRNAVAAMNQGVRSVDEGVLLGRETEGALKKIQESSARSTQMVKAIARATVEQARGSKDVTAAVERIRETVEQISKATDEQARGSEQIVKTSDRMKALAQHVQRSVQEQTHGSKQISNSIENINEMVTHLNRAQKEQTRGSEQVLKAIDTIKAVAETQNRSVKQLEEAIETLRQQADVLRGEIRRFRV